MKTKVYFVCSTVFGIFYTLFNILLPEYSGYMVNNILLKQSIRKSIYVIITVTILLIFFSFLNQLFTKQYGVLKKASIREKIFSVYIKQGIENEYELNQTASFIDNQIPILVTNYYGGILKCITCFTTILFSVTALFKIHFLFSIIIISIGIITSFIPKIISKYAQICRSDYKKYTEEYDLYMRSYFGGLNVIRKFLFISQTLNRQNILNKKIVKAEKKVNNWFIFIYTCSCILEGIKKLLLVIIGAYLILNGKIGAGDLLAAIQIAEILSIPLENISLIIHGMKESKPLKLEYDLYLNDKEQVDKEKKLEYIDKIQFENYCVYDGKHQILSNINIEFFSQKHYLIEGESGSGKSTLLMELAGISNHKNSGAIYINGILANEYNKDSYNKQVCYVSQNPYLFHLSLRDNILLGRNISEKEFSLILEKLNLKNVLEQYKNNILDESTMSHLSGGEKQRIAFARALVENYDVYILDEVTSSLDKENTQIIEDIISSLDGLVVNVSHHVGYEQRRNYDRIYKIRGGIIEKNG